MYFRIPASSYSPVLPYTITSTFCQLFCLHQLSIYHPNLHFNLLYTSNEALISIPLSLTPLLYSNIHPILICFQSLPCNCSIFPFPSLIFFCLLFSFIFSPYLLFSFHYFLISSLISPSIFLSFFSPSKFHYFPLSSHYPSIQSLFSTASLSTSALYTGLVSSFPPLSNAPSSLFPLLSPLGKVSERGAAGMEGKNSGMAQRPSVWFIFFD